ncbi:hypothetical protein H4219_000625 [Mycoemilia scoparia]|uniref:Non-specific serine/threonine protein kinase n=1 Tax=Mycoemilia scoparia TaxID=417184 RepID=A0A9W8A887_9FUNG|nr:hypothetical protein H4219_000625 [Mycoemilia scoparia]
MLPQPPLSRTKRPIALDGSGQPFSLNLSGSTHNGGESRSAENSSNDAWDSRRSGIYYAGGLREYRRELGGPKPVVSPLASSSQHQRLIPLQSRLMSSKGAEEPVSSQSTYQKHEKNPKPGGLAMLASKLLGKGSSSPGGADSIPDSRRNNQNMSEEKSFTHRFRGRWAKFGDNDGGDYFHGRSRSTDANDVATANQIGTPYNIKHDFHIGIDELDEVMEQLPGYFRNMVNTEFTSNLADSDDSHTNENMSLQTHMQLDKREDGQEFEFSLTGTTLPSDFGNFRSSRVFQKGVSTPIYEEMTQSKDSPTFEEKEETKLSKRSPRALSQDRDRERRFGGSHTKSINLKGQQGLVSEHKHRHESIKPQKKTHRPKRLGGDLGEGMNSSTTPTLYTPGSIGASSAKSAGHKYSTKSPQSAEVFFGPDDGRRSMEENCHYDSQRPHKAKHSIYADLGASTSTRSLPALQTSASPAEHHASQDSSEERANNNSAKHIAADKLGTSSLTSIVSSKKSYRYSNTSTGEQKQPKRYSRSSNTHSSVTPSVTPTTATTPVTQTFPTAKDKGEQSASATAVTAPTTTTTAAAKSTPQPPGSQYYNLELFAEGESGNLYSAQRIDSDAKFAIKKIPTNKLDRLKKLRYEVSMMQGVSCPEIVSFFDGFKVNDFFWVIYEYMDMCSLTDLFGGYPSLVLADNVIAYVSRSIFRALSYLHQKSIIHCDIRSDNVLINGKGEVKIADFSNGIKIDRDGNIKRATSGPVYWMAPEIPKGRGYSRKSDIWAAGAVVYEMVEGQPPYIEYPELKVVTLIKDNGLAPWSSANTISSTLKSFISKACNVDLDARYTADQMLKDEFLSADNVAEPTDLLKFVESVEALEDDEEDGDE